MKKFSVLSIVLFVGLVLVGCSSLPSKTPTILEGVWKQIDGSAVFTFRNNKYELVDMERGVAGYGKIKLYIKDGIETIEFINDFIYDIKGSTIASKKYDRELKQFQIQAFEEYHKSHPEQMGATKKKLAEEGGITGEPVENLDKYGHSGSGGFYVPYILDGDILNIPKRTPRPSGNILFYDDSFVGQFVRQ